MTLFVCTGDSHIGKGVHLYPGRLDDQERVWRETLELARDRGAAAVLHAGDLFDRRRPTPDVIVAAERPLVEHAALGGPPVHVIAGNHDEHTVDCVCGLDVLHEAGLVIAHRKPEVATIPGAESHRVAFLPWAPVSRLVAGLDLADRDEVYGIAGDMLARAARDLVESTADVGVLVAHWSVTGAKLPSGLPVEQVREVIVDRHELEALGLRAIVLGHIHRPGNVADSTTAFYTGSPMTLDHGEAGVAHGVLVYDVTADTLERVELDAPRFVTVNLDAFDEPDVDYTNAVVRVRDTVGGSDSVDYAALRDAVLSSGALAVDVQVTVERPQRADRDDADTELEPAQLFAEWLEHGEGIGPAEVDRLVELARGYLEHARDEVPA